ncbi:MAG: beta-1,6-N-acetylglucosaminyltransferase, partial [Pseudomonadota bacterium]
TDVVRLAGHLTDQGAPVAVHMDRASHSVDDVRTRLRGDVQLLSTRVSEWGGFGLVEATLDTVGALLTAHRDVGYVYLLCGASLPLRPVEELRTFLSENSRFDFIEACEPDEWITGGLGSERFSLHHPFSWKRQRWLFDRSVDLQRRVGVDRAPPHAIKPCLGRQWWCLRAETLRRILADQRLPAFKRFFRRVWIPDESFFQSLVSDSVPPDQMDGRGLTLTRFDSSGNPLIFHDDHRGTLEQSDHFFVRKIDRDAQDLKNWAFDRAGAGNGDFDDRVPEQLLDSRPPEHQGLQMAGRFPRGTGVMRPDTAVPYLILLGCDRVALSDLRQRLTRTRPDWAIHGHLFGPHGADFASHGSTYRGNLSALPTQRDYRPEQFLRNLVWADRDRFTVFLMMPGDNGRTLDQVTADANACLVSLDSGARSAIRATANPKAQIAFLDRDSSLSTSATIGEIISFAERAGA